MIGRWGEKDILMSIDVDGVKDFRDRCKFSALNYSRHYDLAHIDPWNI
ncbi:MAG TPA: hypothetical protein GXX20_03195 [Clostridiaceae bacterium]|nr:hypothetical protein [Clostridiaceae bacterium]